MRECTYEEYASTQGKWNPSETRRMHTKRTQDVYHSDCGTEVASCHVQYTRSKPRTYMVNPAYLKVNK